MRLFCVFSLLCLTTSFSTASPSPLLSSRTCATLSPGSLTNPLSFTMPDVCYGILDYNTVDVTGTCLPYLQGQAAVFPNLWSMMTAGCRPYLAKYMCGLLFPQCFPNSTAPLSLSYPCIEDCRAVAAHCSNPIDAYMLNLLEPQILSNCSSPSPSSSSSSSSSPSPPSPLGSLSSGLCTSAAPTPLTASAVRVPRCEVYNRTACSGVSRGQQMYIPAGLTGMPDPQGFIEQALTYTKFAWSLGPTVGDCPTHMAQWMCSQAILGCQSFSPTPLGLAGPVSVFPQLPCQSVCAAYANSSCAALFNQLPSKLLPACATQGNFIQPTPSSKCDGSFTDPPQPDWPVSSAHFGYVTTSCNDMVRTSYTPRANVNCPYPLVIPDDPNSPNKIQGGPCATPCPLLLISDSTYSEVDVFMKVLGTFSLVGSFFLAITWLTFKKKRDQTILLMFTQITFFTSLLETIHNFLPVSSIGHGTHIAGLGCKNNADQNDGGYCFFYAFVQIYNTGALITWWCLLALDLWSKVALNYRPPPSSREHRIKMTTILTTGLLFPLLMVGLSAAMNILGNADGVSWCGIHNRNPNWPEAGWGTFYFPVLILLLVGTYCTSHTIFVLWQSSHSVSSSHSKKKGRWKKYVRVLLFIFFFWVLYGFVFAYRTYVYFGQNTWLNSATDMITCLLVTSPGFTAITGLPYTPACPTTPTNSTNVPLWFLIHFSIACQGSLNFVLYGTMLENVQLWAELCSKYFRCRCCVKLASALSRNQSSTQDTSRTDTSRMSSPSNHGAGAGAGGERGNTTMNNDGQERRTRIVKERKEREKERDGKRKSKSGTGGTKTGVTDNNVASPRSQTGVLAYAHGQGHHQQPSSSASTRPTSPSAVPLINLNRGSTVSNVSRVRIHDDGERDRIDTTTETAMTSGGSGQTSRIPDAIRELEASPYSGAESPPASPCPIDEEPVSPLSDKKNYI